jgi:photosystem II stability/assembly factor-like uncharacterized protein
MSSILITRRTLLAGGTAAALLPSCSAKTGVESASLPATLTWEKLPTAPFRGKQDDIAFGSSLRGWYGNGEGLVFRTDDAGDSWQQVWAQPGTFVRALGFFDAETGILGNVGVGSFPNVKDRTPLYRTSDGGKTWAPVTQIDGPVPEGICAIEISRSMIIDRGHPSSRNIVHAAGRVGGPAHYLRSTDGGVSWKSWDLSALTAAIYDVKFLNQKTGFIAGSSDADLRIAVGLILRTDDGGNSWRVVYRSARAVEAVWKLHFPSKSVGYGSVQSYDPTPTNTQRYVAKTVDGGATWTEVPLVNDAKWRSFAIGFANEQVGWVGGNLGGLETRDGGATWRPVEMGKAVNKIRFVDAGNSRRAYAIGSEVHRLVLPPI